MLACFSKSKISNSACTKPVLILWQYVPFIVCNHADAQSISSHSYRDRSDQGIVQGKLLCACIQGLVRLTWKSPYASCYPPFSNETRRGGTVLRLLEVGKSTTQYLSRFRVVRKIQRKTRSENLASQAKPFTPCNHTSIVLRRADGPEVGRSMDRSI